MELKSEWNVVIFSHQLFAMTSPGKPVTEFLGYTSSGNKIVNTLKDISAESTIIAVISGHTHYDFSQNVNGFLEICTTCDTRQEYGGLPDNAGTINEQAFDVFTIDIANRKLFATRIGRGQDREWSW